MEIRDKLQRSWMFWLALITLISGCSLALIAALAPLGFRFNLWGYRTGFEVLRTIVPWSIYIAGLCLAVAAFFGIMARVRDLPDTRKLVGFAITGAIAAGLTWFVPQSYLAPEDQPYPSIHDISTDTVNPPRFVAVLPLRANADNGVEYGVSRDMTPELLVQLTQEAYPDLQSVILDVSPDTAFNRALAAVETLGWELVAADKTAGRIEATDTTFWFRFKDDIVIRLRPENSGVRIDARSVSRMGKGDVGINAKRLRHFFDIL